MGEAPRPGGDGTSLHRVPGRLVLAEPPATLWAGRGYALWRSADHGRSWVRETRLPRAPWRRLVERSRLASRVLRHEVRALLRLADGTLVASSREGVYHGRAGDAVLRPSRIEEGKLPFMPPMRLAAGPDGVIVFGEYGAGRGRPMRLYASHDRGRTFHVVRTFEAGCVAHVHNVLWDARRDHYWVLAGDKGEEPGFGILSRDLRHFEWFVKGAQRYRAVAPFDLGDHLLYATDSEVEPNGLVRLHKETGATERLRDFEGSCIYACRYGELLALTTTVEPSAVNRCDEAALWLSRDGERWRCAFRARKDRWSGDWFQYASLVLPVGRTDRETVAWSGQAVAGIDGATLVATPSPALLAELAPASRAEAPARTQEPDRRGAGS